MASSQDLNRLLRQWGLKPNEARVLQACMQRGRGLYVHEVVTLTKIQRSTIDLILTRLIERGFLLKQRVDRRYVYVAESLETLQEKQTQQLDLLKSLKPLFDSWQNVPSVPSARVMMGLDGINDLYREILAVLGPLPAEQRKLLSIESGLDVLRVRPDLEKYFIQERVRKHIHIDILCPTSSKELEPYQPNAKKLRDCRYFDSLTKDFTMAMYIYGDRVALLSLRQPLQVVVLQHPVITTSLRTVCRLLWQSLS